MFEYQPAEYDAGDEEGEMDDDPVLDTGGLVFVTYVTYVTLVDKITGAFKFPKEVEINHF